MISADTTFEPSENVTVSSLGNDETVLLDLTSWEYFTLNETGSFIWTCITDGATFTGIVDGLCAEWDVAREEAENNVRALLDDLIREGLVRKGA